MAGLPEITINGRLLNKTETVCICASIDSCIQIYEQDSQHPDFHKIPQVHRDKLEKINTDLVILRTFLNRKRA